jgi:hypothetical protein
MHRPFAFSEQAFRNAGQVRRHTGRVCCFSIAGAPVGLVASLFAARVHVSRTNIFARMLEPGVQGLAYGMDLKTRRELAMVLPLPVAPGRGDDAVRFIDLSATPRMFEDLAALFDLPLARKKGGFALPRFTAKRLVVHDVGAFVASYVPARADFARLDPRFRLPDAVFDAVPHYADHGFAVFQLKPGNVTVHPMAFAFPTRAPDRLFFPTVHVHDGRFHATAKFDHALYYQHPRAGDAGEGRAFERDTVGWTTPARDYAGLVDPDRAIVRRTVRARLPNADTWIPAA